MVGQLKISTTTPIEYSILGVSPDMSLPEIKTIYRKLVLTYHPDKGGNREKFEEINKAYKTIEKWKS